MVGALFCRSGLRSRGSVAGVNGARITMAVFGTQKSAADAEKACDKGPPVRRRGN